MGDSRLSFRRLLLLSTATLFGRLAVSCGRSSPSSDILHKLDTPSTATRLDFTVPVSHSHLRLTVRFVLYH